MSRRSFDDIRMPTDYHYARWKRAVIAQYALESWLCWTQWIVVRPSMWGIESVSAYRVVVRLAIRRIDEPILVDQFRASILRVWRAGSV